MGEKKNYETLIEQRRAVEEASAKYIARLNYLRGVGLSVIAKSYGTTWHGVKATQNMSFLGALGVWLLDGGTLTEMGENYITFRTAKAVSNFARPGSWEDTLKKHAKNGTYQIPREIIHMSDRDFAKHLRKKLRAHREALGLTREKQRLENIQKLEKELQDLQSKSLTVGKALEAARDMEKAREAKAKYRAEEALKRQQKLA